MILTFPRAGNLRRTQISRLAKYLKHKQDLERQITNIAAELGEQYEAMKTELGAAIAGKIDDTTRAETILQKEIKTLEASADEVVENQMNVDPAEDGHGSGQARCGHAGRDPGSVVVRNVPARTRAKQTHVQGRSKS